MSSSSTNLEGQEYLILIGNSNSIIHNAVASAAFFIWEYCITIDAEVEFIWRAQWTWITSLFITIRYLTLTNVIVMMVMATNVLGAIHPSQMGCSAWFWFEVISAPILLLCVEILLIARVFAFYERNRILLAALVTLSLFANAARFSLIAVLGPKLNIIQNPLPPNLPIGACIVVDIPPLFSNSWIPEFIPEAVLFFLVVFRVIRERLHTSVTTSRVLVVLVRDGSWAFVLIFAGSVWALLEFELTDNMGLIPLAWMVSFLGFCGSRLVLNLRSAAKNPVAPVHPEDAFEFGPIHQYISAAHGEGHCGDADSGTLMVYDLTCLPESPYVEAALRKRT